MATAVLGSNDDCEQIELETVIYRKVVRRKRYRRTCECRQQPHTVTAPMPPMLLPKSLYGTSIWTHLLMEKYHLQRPTQRTIEQFRLLGLSLAPGTIVDGPQVIEPLMTPIYEVIRAHHVWSRSRPTIHDLTEHENNSRFTEPGGLLRRHSECQSRRWRHGSEG
jgi:transposase